MVKSTDIATIRRDYGNVSLDEHLVSDDPMIQFQTWFETVLNTEMYDPTAVVLSTVAADGIPDSRVVLLKGFEKEGFCFYSNYQSVKAEQLHSNPYAALNFYWPQLARQVRIRGKVKRLSAQKSDQYFSSRPYESQLSALISPQSHEISNRACLEQALKTKMELLQNKKISRPEHWGGYCLYAHEMEFWQGRDNRLHDRVQYKKNSKVWTKRRLAP